jgi:SAM-dependent methyltransferase
MELPPLSVWATAQQSSRAQRSGRYVAESMAHPGKMLPAVARQAIATYTRPHGLVLDPMCGIGTSLVEAVHLGRNAVGIEYEPRWTDLARRNLGLAAGRGAPGSGEVVTGDARAAGRLLHERHRGRVELLLTSPPYGSVTHGRVRQHDDGRVVKQDHRYSTDRDNLAHQPVAALLAGFTEILAGCRPFLAPDAVVVVTVRPFRSGGQLVDFPSLVAAAAVDAGLVLAERNVALLAGVRGDRLVPRASFFALRNLRGPHRSAGFRHVRVHEDVLVFTTR